MYHVYSSEHPYLSHLSLLESQQTEILYASELSNLRSAYFGENVLTMCKHNALDDTECEIHYHVLIVINVFFYNTKNNTMLFEITFTG